ncbi:MAG: hypothetical protein D6723_13635 [Acidobacteria bacterium]|nr:MAG: hypothetical protein D6723_13635 [Acidobacteriota bacterium]
MQARYPFFRKFIRKSGCRICHEITAEKVRVRLVPSSIEDADVCTTDAECVITSLLLFRRTPRVSHLLIPLKQVRSANIYPMRFNMSSEKNNKRCIMAWNEDGVLEEQLHLATFN